MKIHLFVDNSRIFLRISQCIFHTDRGTCVEIQFVHATGKIHEDRRTVTCGATFVVCFMFEGFFGSEETQISVEFCEKIIMLPDSACLFSLNVVRLDAFV